MLIVFVLTYIWESSRSKMKYRENIYIEIGLLILTLMTLFRATCDNIKLIC